MSEANAPFNRPEQADADSSGFEQQDAFVNPFGEAPEEDIEESSMRVLPFGTEGNIFQNAASVVGKNNHPPASAHSVPIAPEVESWLNSSESTDLADLISLIQELNQCNSILLDRVSQLEEALERSQNALKAEVKRSHDHTFADYNPGLAAAQDLAAAQEQAIDLYNQLEFVHQTSQRQQILIETLTGQLETSQERVAQLEREAALVQQRYNEQTQLLTHAENNCRDFQARLHRQQRYTLQFKVALEKSLDVSTPHYEPVAEVLGVASSAESSFLPRVQHIEPWTSPVDISPARFPWMKLSSEPLPSESVTAQAAPASSPQVEIPSVADLPVVKSRRSKLAAVKLPGFPSSESAPATNPALPPEPAQSVDLSAIPNEKLMQKLDSMVQPLADLLAEAVLTEVNAANEAPTAVEPEIDSATNAPMTSYSSTDYATSSTDADNLLNSVMADAEDALWQDLARLIDVSTEEVVKASLSGDLSAFESINFDALQPAEATSQEEVRPAVQHSESRFPAKGNASRVEAPEWVEPPAFSAEPNQPIADEPAQTTAPAPSLFGAAPGWPAPLIYPTRPAQKRRSLAAVDLPSFLQQQPGPLPT